MPAPVVGGVNDGVTGKHAKVNLNLNLNSKINDFFRVALAKSQDASRSTASASRLGSSAARTANAAIARILTDHWTEEFCLTAMVRVSPCLLLYSNMACSDSIQAHSSNSRVRAIIQ